MQDFVWFHTIESEIGLSLKFWGKWNSSAPYLVTCTQIASLLFLLIYIVHVSFCAISSTRNRKQLILKILEKYDNSTTCWAIFTKSWQTSIYVKATLNLKFQKILCICQKTFVSHTCRHTDGHFPDMRIRIVIKNIEV